jgi:eukaryotic-like serine/threonine-protein kinase
MAILKRLLAGSGPAPADPQDCSAVLAAFTAAWGRGEAPVAEQYLNRLDPLDSRAAVDLIYREFCLSEADGGKPDLAHYLSRFPEHKSSLERLIGLHGACSPSLLGRWMETTPSLDALPTAGDEIGPFVLLRELGSGAFARVFLAEQTNLENRLVVLKVSTLMTREPWLLARVRHAHIVEIVSHATVDDGAFHLICMPFWGGATLGAVLAVCRGRAHRPSSGNDLLAALDSVAAAEFPTVHTARPAREILAGLTYNQAVAWVIARLAEALDYAFSRDVAHGDVKPSNILLAADANPLLLDFNLARDRSAGGSAHAGDAGGTLAYMAPERLRGIKTYDLSRDDASRDGEYAGQDREPKSTLASRSITRAGEDQNDGSPHHADIYSLGMVMLEALTGQLPAPSSATDVSAQAADDGRKRANGNGDALSPAGGAKTTIQKSAADGWGPIPPGLRAILERCLNPDPCGRYRRGLELAEDLDRWRSDRPFVYTAEPFWGQTVPRKLRRQRRAFVTAGVSLCVILATTAVALFYSHQTLQAIGNHKLGRIWDDPEARAVRFQRPTAPRLLQPDDSRVETAIRALNEYELLGPADWRRRDDVRALPQVERDDLEVWLMEQAYLYCRALEDRPHSPADWRRALKVLDHVGGPAPVPAFAGLRHRLSVRLGTEEAISSPAPAAGRSSREESSLVNEYLLGVVAECEAESNGRGQTATALGSSDRGSNSDSVVGDAVERTRLAAERARDHYHRFLELQPASFWGHYRAASVEFFMGGSDHIAEAADHLERCLERRPNNPTVHHNRAACLMALNQNSQAQREVETAIERAPDIAEFYRTRATIRANLKHTGGLADDVRHFELLTHLFPRSFWDRAPQDADSSQGSRAERDLPFQRPFELGARLGDPSAESARDVNIAEASPGEFEARVGLAIAIRQAGDLELAEDEFGKILLLEPDHIGVRMTCAVHAIDAGRLDEALPNLKAILYHPGLADYLRAEPSIFARVRDPNHRTLLELFHDASRRFCYSGKLDDGRAIARRAVDLAIELDQPRGMSHYNLARAYADSAALNRAYVEEAADQLFCAFVANPLYKEKYAHDDTFDAVRASIDAALARMPDPSEEYRRRLADLSTAGGR